MKIILVGAGRIGSAVAFCLAKAGHDITVVARGERFNALRRDGAITTVDGQLAQVEVRPGLDPTAPCDLTIVTVPEHQIGSLLPALSASRANHILLMFNTFKGTEHYRTILGAERFAFGFPNMSAYLVDHRLRFRVDGPGMVTTMSSPDMAALFKEAGMPSEVEHDMDAFLRSHVALVVPLFLSALLTSQRSTQLTWSEARRLNAAWTEGFDVVQRLGHQTRPRSLAMLLRMPSLVRTSLLWFVCRLRIVKDLGEFGPTETRALIDAMAAAAPGKTPRLLALRP
ncbi:ketopantoate reductase family protein [Paraburkholderia silvatlantica]|uniref:Ketopantoate reductase PanE/ApbA n=2 Tax=cellular organisms TaxID=131567 RepID=W2TY65_NECAM|nr:2-dehydropantoate 2-reductase N-terminal domain-containing protein [Paraburkholderia silvatlantica]XP_013308851.1 ketopantoate reductase PanE/ApbA [Necator americanus]ETN86624.1 ketopantoate reductase PanE/ApbA [Necator americanus]MBB2931252.1 2-dehydropantoate 2-reductase [Paraburkholderia silvatlantica]PVY28307.1 2-dehydropantoate 2-reductase [Paraburkholderia silvatlantica]PXW34992.1 2-dehydropantoate 2-reductase [Paraburkholderia silvatlantica]TDQ98899.1 2-dehydropantoate 2-reductase [